MFYGADSRALAIAEAAAAQRSPLQVCLTKSSRSSAVVAGSTVTDCTAGGGGAFTLAQSSMIVARAGCVDRATRAHDATSAESRRPIALVMSDFTTPACRGASVLRYGPTVMPSGNDVPENDPESGWKFPL
jgi:hypothetical protein